APRHRRPRPLAPEELELALPALRRQGVPPIGHGGTLRLVRGEHLVHRRGYGHGAPLCCALLQRVDDHLLLTDDLPRNLLRRSRLWVRPVVGALGYPREHVARRLRFVDPEARKERFLVHDVSCQKRAAMMRRSVRLRYWCGPSFTLRSRS